MIVSSYDAPRPPEKRKLSAEMSNGGAYAERDGDEIDIFVGWYSDHARMTMQEFGEYVDALNALRTWWEGGGQ